MITFKIDSRDLSFHKVGTTSQFPPTLNFNSGLADLIQPVGDVKCTCYTTDGIAADQDKVKYDIDDLFNRIPHTDGGADPRDSLGEACKNGLKRLTGEIDKNWTRFYTAHTGDMDAFDNARSAMVIAQSPLAIWTHWYAYEWNVGINGVMPIGKTATSNHMYILEGFDTINGVPMFIVNAFTGGTMYMPRETFNSAVGALGASTAVLSTLEIDIRHDKTIYEKIIDALKNIIVAYQVLLLNQKTQMTPNQHPKIILWANAIKAQEGARPELNNPGNIKFSSLTKSWGGMPGHPALDGGSLCKFPTYDMGFTALCNFLTLGAENQLLAFHQARTLEAFSKIYAGNPPQGYIDRVAQALNVPLTTDIATFLT